MELEKIEKEIEIKITLTKEEAEQLKQIIWFSFDYEAQQQKLGKTTMYDSEKELANKLFDFLDKAGC